MRGQVDRNIYEDELPLAHISFSRDYDGQALGVMRFDLFTLVPTWCL